MIQRQKEESLYRERSERIVESVGVELFERVYVVVICVFHRTNVMVKVAGGWFDHT